MKDALYLAALVLIALASDLRASEPQENCTLEDLQWLIGVSESSEKLTEDIPNFANKGDEVTVRVETRPELDGKFLISRGLLIYEGKTMDAFMEIWGSHMGHKGVYKWYYDSKGGVLEGKIVREGKDKFVHMIKGKSLMSEDEAGELALFVRKMGLKEFEYSGEVAFRRIKEESFGVTVRAVQIAGFPFPWPDLGVEKVQNRVE